MPDSQPPALHLLDSALAYLEEQLLPTLSGYHRFQTRVTINALAMVRRELAEGAAADAREEESLITLMGRPGRREELNAALAADIRSGRRAIDDPALIAHLKAVTAAALAINNPRWLTER